MALPAKHTWRLHSRLFFFFSTFRDFLLKGILYAVVIEGVAQYERDLSLPLVLHTDCHGKVIMLRGKDNSLCIKENIRTGGKLRRKHITQE